MPTMSMSLPQNTRDHLVFHAGILQIAEEIEEVEQQNPAGPTLNWRWKAQGKGLK